MDQDHNPLLLEDVIAEKSSSLAEDKCLEVATAKKDEGDAGGSRVDPTKGNDPIHVATKLGEVRRRVVRGPYEPRALGRSNSFAISSQGMVPE